MYSIDSNATTVVPAIALASNSNTTSTLPSAFSAVKVVLAVTFSPSIRTGSLVSLFIKVPVTVYSFPGNSEEYETVSMIFAFGSASV